jgi:hypothetical protein
MEMASARAMVEKAMAENVPKEKEKKAARVFEPVPRD